MKLCEFDLNGGLDTRGRVIGQEGRVGARLQEFWEPLP
jgi:hypothetical protein